MNRKHKAIIAYMLALLAFTTYVVLDTFFITRVYGEEDPSAAQNNEITEQQDTAGEQAQQQDAAPESTESGGKASGSDQAEPGGEASGSDQAEAGGEDSEAGNKHSGSGGSGKTGHGKGGPGMGAGGKHSGKGPGGNRSGDGRSSGNQSDSSESNNSDSSSDASASSSDSSSDASASTSTESDSYSDGNISITMKQYRENGTTVYVADVEVSDPSYLKTALAQGAYGRNVTQKTSEIADSVNAILAINGDYYGAQEKGYVIRNGKLYRDTALANQEDLVIYEDGSFGIINESNVTAQELISSGAVQTLSFGPALVQNGNISVNENEEVGRAMASNPRTAIGIIDKNHYVFVVSDGRSSESEGMSLYELAAFMDSLGVTTAYNLDGGGSSTMYFKGKVINNPTTGGSTTRERSVSDIVYIG